MALKDFRGMTPEEREKHWFNLYQKYQTYPGTLREFLKEHDIAASPFYRWSSKFKKQAMGNIPDNADSNNESPCFSPISPIDKAIQQSVDVIDDGHLEEENQYDDLDKKISQLEAHDNAIMAAMELVLPEGYKIRLTNHADVSLAIRLVQGITRDE